MLGSLLKYDFRALNKVMIPLQLGVLLAGILGTVCVNLFTRSVASSLANYSYSTYSTPSTSSQLLEGFTQSVLIMCGVLLLSLVYISMFITLALIARHIYRNFYSSEGYLTFTLPISVDKHLFSKGLSGFIWMVINGLIVCAITVVLIIFGFATEGLVNVDILRALSSVWEAFLTPLGIVFIVELVIMMVLGIVLYVTQVIFSIVMGGASARTHKVLAAIGFYFLSGMVISFVSGIVSFFLYGILYSMDSMVYLTADSWFAAFQPTMISGIVVYIALVAVMYVVSRLSLKQNLNLD